LFLLQGSDRLIVKGSSETCLELRVKSMKILHLSLLAASTLPLLLGQGGDWPNVGNDPGGMRYSSLKQITPANVSKLVRAWTYDTGDPGGGFRGTEATPIVVNGLMYFSTPGGKVVALNAATGAEVWKYDLKEVTPSGRGAKYGVSFWPGDGNAAPRVVVATTDGLLLQLDSKTGKLFKDVGDNGVVDLKVGMVEKYGGGYTPGATPAIYKNLAIISPTTGEQGRYGIAGDPRAFDLKTGKEVWRFHTVPQPGEPEFSSWGPDGWQDRRGPGAWVPMTVDTQNGLVFVPLGNATDQNYGGSRPGKNLYATSLVALDATTGKLKWYYQTTHHDIYDWDVNAPPTLIEVTKDGKKIPAVAQSTKLGLLFILDRMTGKAIFGDEERPVPDTDAPGDHASPTQPFPLKPEPISRISMTREEVSKISPETEKTCKAQYDKLVQMGPYTPYGMTPSLVFPSSEGGGSWSGASFDPGLGYIFVNTRSVGTLAKLNPTTSSGILPSYAKQKIPFEDQNGYPCSAPPWGELMAVSAATGDIVWRVPLGEYKDLTAKGVPKTGTPNAGGPIITAGGVLFIGATADLMFRAFDPKTGKELWSTQLENSAVNTPLTYQAGGKQYVSVWAGGGLGDFKTSAAGQKTNLIVAYSLP
jgi:quinoprotein glucose dehydrogenase